MHLAIVSVVSCHLKAHRLLRPLKTKKLLALCEERKDSKHFCSWGIMELQKEHFSVLPLLLIHLFAIAVVW